MKQRDFKIKEVIREMAAEYFSRQSNRLSLITVTDVELSGKGSKAAILITVMPVDKELDALEFVHRQLSDFREHVQNNSRIARVPYFDVRIDVGEKNRQRIDEIGKNL